MIEENDVVMACISGGKDSFAMLDILLRLREAAPIKFDVAAVNSDQTTWVPWAYPSWVLWNSWTFLTKAS